MLAYERLLRPILFRLDPEWTHNAGLKLIARGLVRTRLVRDPRLVTKAFGCTFSNPIGLAAGFDKNAVAVSRWGNLGFGFFELGTVTPLPQPGNPRPRLFRLPVERAVINRFGFNSDGADAIAHRLQATKPPVPFGINLGKNKETPNELAADDYSHAYRRLSPFGQYAVINVSSPNTPGLRGLQARDSLEPIIAAMREVDASKPMFIKLSPDVRADQLEEVARVSQDLEVTGLIATNTTVDRTCLVRDPGIEGGLSGAPLRARSNEVLAHLAGHVGSGKTLIGVGGIFTGEDVLEKLRLGAKLVQVYTGWVYRGPSAVPRMLLELLGAMEREGIASLSELR